MVWLSSARVRLHFFLPAHTRSSKIAVLFGLRFVVAVVQLVSRLTIYGINPPVRREPARHRRPLAVDTLGTVLQSRRAVLLEEDNCCRISSAENWRVPRHSDCESLTLLFATAYRQWRDMIAYLPSASS